MFECVDSVDVRMCGATAAARAMARAAARPTFERSNVLYWVLAAAEAPPHTLAFYYDVCYCHVGRRWPAY